MSSDWSLDLDPRVLLPDRRARATLTYRPSKGFAARQVSLTLRCVEQWRYDTTVTETTPTGGTQTRRETRTGRETLHEVGWQLAGPTTFVAGQPVSWTVEIDVPGLGPASFEGEELRCDWSLEAKIDRAMAIDERESWNVHVAQPMALLRAGVVSVGMYGLYEEAPANLDALPAQIRLEPVPINLWAPFSGSFTVETAAPLSLQEVRLELRVKVGVTVSGGRSEEIRVGGGRLEQGPVAFGGPLAAHHFSGDAPQAWLPTVDLPHGRARGAFHVILARAWAPDDHYVRDVALATTDAL